MRIFCFYIILIFISQNIVFGQEVEKQVNSEDSLNQLLLPAEASLGYLESATSRSSQTTSGLALQDFNKGYLTDANLLWKGKLAGVSIFKKGGNPNVLATVRIRGLSTMMMNASPLIVVDGVPVTNLEAIDPLDIVKVEVLKEAAATSIYGIRGSKGVMLITTNIADNTPEDGITVTSNLAISELTNALPALDRQNYLAIGGIDLGANTNWLDEVSQTAISNVQQIAYTTSTDQSSFRISTTYRNVNGILKNSGFNRLNTNFKMKHKFLNNKLRLTAGGAYAIQQSQLGFEEAFRYATIMNPTSPIRFENGNFYEAILFDNYNPVSIIESSQNDRRRINQFYNAAVAYEPLKDVVLKLQTAYQFNSQESGEYYTSTAFFRGYNRNGLARRGFGESDNYFAEFTIAFKRSFPGVNLQTIGGYGYQQSQHHSTFIELGNFPSDDLGYNALENSGDRLSGDPFLLNINSDQSPNNKLVSFFNQSNLSFNNGLNLMLNLRYEGSSLLGENEQWGLFHGLGLSYDVNRFLKVDGFNGLNLRMNFGKSGGLPNTHGLSQARYQYSFQNGGTVEQTQLANPDLKWEEMTEVDIGLDFSYKNVFSGSLDYYNRTSTDLILPILDENFDELYANVGELQTKGVEFTLNHSGINFSSFSWSAGFVASSSSTTVNKYSREQELRANPGAGGCCSTQYIRVAEGEKIGEFWSPVFAGVDANGLQQYQDLNGDGQVLGDPGQALDPNADFTSTGNALPTFEFGITNRLHYKNFQLEFLLRGALGHSLVNSYRLLYEPIDIGALGSYNRVITDKAVEGLTSTQFSSIYIEKADFLRMDYLNLTYSLPANRSFKSLELIFTAQNLFTITSYSGYDPEPVPSDVGPVDNGGFINSNIDLLAPGIDRRNFYYTARTFTLGIKIVL